MIRDLGSELENDKRRQTEETLRLSEERFRLLVETVKDYAIFMLDPTGHVATWNAGAERIKGYRADEIIGSSFERFYPQVDIDAGKCAMELDVATREGRFEDEGWRLRKDGSRFWANVVITALRDEGGELVGFAKVTRDLTERRRAEEERLQVGRVARHRLDMLAKLAEALAGATTVEEVGRTVLDEGMAFAGSDTCTLYILDERTMTLELVAERGCNPNILDRVRRIRADDDNPSYAIGIGKAPALWVETKEEYAATVPALANIEVEGPRAQAFWCVPVSAEGRVIGMIGTGFHGPRHFPPDERQFVETFARQCGQALLRARRLATERASAAVVERLSAWLATTLRSIGDAVIATDKTGHITLMNSVAEALTGWPESDARGRPLTDVFRIVNEHTRETVESPVARVLETGGIVGLANHTVLLARDGREIPIDDSGAPIKSEIGALQGVVLVFRDVTDRKRLEAQSAFLANATTILAESLAYEATVAKVARLSVPTFADWCAVDLVIPGQSLPKRVAVAHVDASKVALAHELHTKYPPRMDDETGLPNVLRTGTPELYAEIPDELLVKGCVDAEHLRIARELRLRSAMVVPLIAHERVLGAMSFVRAESERKYTEADVDFAQELARRCAMFIENARLLASEQDARKEADVANRAKDEFLAVVSHELRTPLNAIMGWAKLLASEDFDPQRRQRAIETIARNSVTMAQLIDDLLDMSRVISGKMRLEVQAVDISSVVEAAVESIQPAATAKDIRISSVLDTTTPSLMGDPTRLQQIVWNLMSNAVKFTPREGRVEVIVRRVSSSLEISVSDTGKGIDPSFLPNVFEPFRQEDASTTRTRGGLGLGLAITRQLVELHGGRIRVESAGEGKGATFTVALPVSAIGVARRPPKSAATTQEATGYERPAHLRGLQVLVVDDDEDARRLVSAILEDCGAIVTTASSVQEAMMRLSEREFDVLLSDIGMPGEDGFDLIRKVRALPRDKRGDIPAAALTAYARPEDRRKMLNAGYSMHLAKPIEPAELVAVVATLTRFMHRGDS